MRLFANLPPHGLLQLFVLSLYFPQILLYLGDDRVVGDLIDQMFEVRNKFIRTVYYIFEGVDPGLLGKYQCVNNYLVFDLHMLILIEAVL